VAHIIDPFSLRSKRLRPLFPALLCAARSWSPIQAVHAVQVMSQSILVLALLAVIC